jgi:hypothetical protein
MLATAARPRAASPARDAAPEPATRPCPYCRSALDPAAKKCRSCGEWTVGTSTGLAASLLRLLGWLWAGGSLLAAAGVWYGGAAVRAWLIARAVDPVLTPLVLSALLYVLTAVVVMQGLTVGVGLNVLAGLTPRRPRWWS